MMLPLPNLFLVRNKGEIISLAEVLGAKRLSDHSVWASQFTGPLWGGSSGLTSVGTQDLPTTCLRVCVHRYKGSERLALEGMTSSQCPVQSVNPHGSGVWWPQHFPPVCLCSVFGVGRWVRWSCGPQSATITFPPSKRALASTLPQTDRECMLCHG